MLAVYPAYSAHPTTPQRSSRRKHINLSPCKPKPRPRVNDLYPVTQISHTKADEMDDESQEAEFPTNITFFDQQQNQFRLIQPNEIDQILSLLREYFPGVIAVMPRLTLPYY
jgi:hypothetical protein